MTDPVISSKSLLFATGLTFVLFSCNDHETCTSQEPEAATKVKTPEQLQSNIGQDPTANEQISFAINDLASRLGVDQNSINTPSVTPLTWRSGALGCPKPGMNYLQSLVPGVMINFWVDNVSYQYHASLGGEPFFCPPERTEPPANVAGVD